MKRILFAVFGVIIMLPMASMAVDCTMVDGQCPAGCGYSEITHDCTICPTGAYSPGGTSECLTCSKPLSANFADNDGGMTEDACPWTISCPSGHYFDNANLTCVPCGTYYNAKGDTTCEISGTGQGTITSYDGNCTQTARCDGKVYTLTLKRNTGKDKTAYFKYGAGFSENSTGSWNPQKLPDTALQDSKPVQTFVGYFNNNGALVWEERDQYFSSNGTLTKTQAELADLAEDNVITLWAGWSFSPYYIYYYYDSTDATPKDQSCGGDKDYDGSTCKTLSYQWGTPPEGSVFTGYKCYTNDEFSDSCIKQFYTPDEPIAPPENDDEKTRYFVAQYQVCPIGHYCDSNGQHECPGGTTTTSTGTSSISSCVMQRGASGTKFCDSTGNCFYIPDSRINSGAIPGR